MVTRERIRATGTSLISAVLMVISVGMPLFGRDVVFPLLAPLGLSQLILAVWLMTRGFRGQAGSATEARRRQGRQRDARRSFTCGARHGSLVVCEVRQQPLQQLRVRRFRQVVVEAGVGRTLSVLRLPPWEKREARAGLCRSEA